MTITERTHAALPGGLARRDALRLGLLAVSLAGGASALTACSSEDKPSSDPSRTVDKDGIELISSDVKRAAGDASMLPDVGTGLDSFAGRLYGQLATQPGNLVLSPYSVLVALGMTLAGAAGSTAKEMQQLLGASSGDRWHKGVNALTAHISGLAGEKTRGDDTKAEVALAPANQIFGQRDVAWEAAFVDRLAKEYGAGLRAVDFAEAEKARTLINDWVAEQTEDLIEELIPDGALNEMTRLVLVNALYLKAPWEHPFEASYTEPAPFTRADGSTVNADAMVNPKIYVALKAGTGWRAATLPYAGRELAMTVVLPDAGKLADVETLMAEEGFAPFLGETEETQLEVTLPKWKFRTAAPLTDVLKNLGMPTAFGADADFTPMTDDDLPLVISDAVHQGFIAVDEEGTEAAAATAIVVGEAAAPAEPETFKVDRTFHFVIHDVEYGTPLFVGRVDDPTA